MTLRPAVDAPTELVILSHLRWDFVWQRPQHLISRLAPSAERTFFVEEPRFLPDGAPPRLRSVDAGPVTRLWLELPGEERHCCFGDEAALAYGRMLRDHLGAGPERTVWLYTPMALPVADEIGADLLVYDVMDDLATFANAPARLRELQQATLERADLVFTGGRSLQRSIVDRRPDAHCFPSGVEPEHYRPARRCRQEHPRPVAGYVGVVDERLDLELLAGLAEGLPDWDIQIVGPVVKIDRAVLPQAPNLRYHGPCQYRDLPQVMGGFDVALMPFALNEATRSISPTKTLEYLAAGLPVVSSPVPDVVTGFSEVVDIQTDAAGFADACRRVLEHDIEERDRKVRPLLHWNHWDTIAARMGSLLDAARSTRARQDQPA